MSSDYPPYTRAVKPIDFGRGGVVGVKSPTKQSTWGIVRDFKKLKYIINFPELQLVQQMWPAASQSKAGLYAQVNYAVTRSFRIFNYLILQNTGQGGWQNTDNQFTLCIKFIKNGIIKRYKLRGNKTIIINNNIVPSDCPNDVFGDLYLTTINAPWYNGEKIEPNFVVEVWRQYQWAAPGATMIPAFSIEVSILKLPDTLEETNSEFNPIRILKRTKYTNVSANDLEINFGSAFPVAFRQYSTGG